ncbi:hypothetical protein L861_03340 [Litchfieldella anticariensis FP35 = DSM 16096]|uniref:Uncharacterized protein n=1 Tax=Litchfieldella anticariensis (strain DSM 16096 / CECT 5854 / CIP 108499 / LMG 22089 / FP35) TaxID=1121939 RepID=S2KUX6_LITA3|nr:hypothetical protein L861_03340 [Halomonas anticariensis FP35 = DSM 16096]
MAVSLLRIVVDGPGRATSMVYESFWLLVLERLAHLKKRSHPGAFVGILVSC